MLERKLRDLSYLLQEKGVTQNDDRFSALLRHGAKSTLDAIGSGSVYRQNVYTFLLGGGPNGLQPQWMPAMSRIRQHRDAG